MWVLDFKFNSARCPDGVKIKRCKTFIKGRTYISLTPFELFQIYRHILRVKMYLYCCWNLDYKANLWLTQIYFGDTDKLAEQVTTQTRCCSDFTLRQQLFFISIQHLPLCRASCKEKSELSGKKRISTLTNRVENKFFVVVNRKSF